MQAANVIFLIIYLFANVISRLKNRCFLCPQNVLEFDNNLSTNLLEISFPKVLSVCLFWIFHHFKIQRSKIWISTFHFLLRTERYWEPYRWSRINAYKIIVWYLSVTSLYHFGGRRNINKNFGKRNLSCYLLHFNSAFSLIFFEKEIKHHWSIESL